jgi:hypothetical protein
MLFYDMGRVTLLAEMKSLLSAAWTFHQSMTANRPLTAEDVEFESEILSLQDAIEQLENDDLDPNI